MAPRRRGSAKAAEVAPQPENDESETLETDLVTQLQEDLALVCEHLFVGIGSLQRDARPVPLDDEEVVSTSAVVASAADALAQQQQEQREQREQRGPEDIQAAAERMGADLRESMRRLERHIQLLPDDVVYDTSKRMGGDGVDSAEVRGLVEENKALRAKLEEVVLSRTREVVGLEERHGALVEDMLS
jgi:hypothetical protein